MQIPIFLFTNEKVIYIQYTANSINTKQLSYSKIFNKLTHPAITMCFQFPYSSLTNAHLDERDVKEGKFSPNLQKRRLPIPQRRALQRPSPPPAPRSNPTHQRARPLRLLRWRPPEHPKGNQQNQGKNFDHFRDQRNTH